MAPSPANLKSRSGMKRGTPRKRSRRPDSAVTPATRASPLERHRRRRLSGLFDSARSAPAWAQLTALVAVSTGLRFWAAALVPVPWITPDEFVYGLLGRGLYQTGHLSILGAPVRFYTLVTPLVVGGPLSIGDRGLGYLLLKAVQATVMSLAAVPVYLWGRSFLGPGKALLAAALTLAIPGLAYSGLIMTEVEFYPVAVLAAWALARTLERPTAARQALALAAIALAAATRLQALVLVPALVTAVGVKALLARDLASFRRFAPLLGGMAVIAAAWSGWQLRKGGPATDILGAYRAAGETSYNVHDAALFVLYHAGDLVLMSGVFPFCAAGVLLVEALRYGELSDRTSALLAVTVSWAFWFVAEVGIFASRHVGRLAERDLLALLPLLFLAFALWLERGALRRRAVAPAVALVAFLLVLRLPMGKLVSLAALPDAFTLIPLYRLHVRAPSVSLELVVDLAAAAAAVAFVLVPRRFAWSLPAALLTFLVLTSFSAGRVVTAQATLVRQSTLGHTRDWLDRGVPGPVAYVYGYEVYWNAAWENIFWNKKIHRVYDLLDAKVPGPIPQDSVGPYEDGRLVLADGSPVRERYVVAGSSLRFFGTVVAEAPRADLYAWKIDPPVRLSRLIRSLAPRGGNGVHTEIRVYACAGGVLELDLVTPRALEVELRRNGDHWRTLRLAPGEHRTLRIPAKPRRPLGKRVCSFGVVSDGPVQVGRADFRR